MDWSEYLFAVPYSMLFIFFVNICIVLAGSLVFRLMIDVNRLEAQESEVHGYNKSLNEAKRRNDKAVLRKLKREEVRIKRISFSVSKQRLKVAMITILPFTAVTLFLNILYKGNLDIPYKEREISIFPFEFPLFSKNFSFTIWYFLTYLAAYLPLSRVFRTSPNFWQQRSSES